MGIFLDQHFYIKNFAFLHHFFTLKILLETISGIFSTPTFLHQKFCFFTSKILLFYTNFLHQKFCFLHQFFTSKTLLFLRQKFCFFKPIFLDQKFCFTPIFYFFYTNLLHQNFLYKYFFLFLHQIFEIKKLLFRIELSIF